MISGVSGIGTAGYGAAGAGRPSATGDSAFDAILDDFRKEITKTPAQRAREAVLAKHDLTEEDYQKLPPEKREQIDKEIVEAVRRVTDKRAQEMPAYEDILRRFTALGAKPA